MEEIPEFLITPNKEEMGDLLILILDIAAAMNIDPVDAVLSKIGINNERDFALDEKSGYYSHITR